MIQRIQSLYLLLIVVLMSVTAFSPLLGLRDGLDSLQQTMYSCGIYQDGAPVKPTWGVLSFAALSALVPFINIFLYKKRKVQIKIGMFTTFLLLFFYVTLFTYFYVYTNRVGLELSGIHYGIILPLIAIILNFMALHKIKADEKLVRSLDRIR